ncbi:bacteriohemerythrin [Alkalimarinus alittae]|uniref:Bacteriohemerythrin n=1 Tax=Alkalimarinus alittae TaxID=2961619 RepID=A0ABY6MZP2_9ALTE|nr:bacteriohemerythrin [Alkalimarinus alittae]UZE95289.1 bacteriohemerythrin [Alkalimarinus alittae]
MTIFEWKSEYDTGVEEIDNQHKVLVSLINELNSLVSGQFDREAAGEVFKKLKGYTVFHFSTEESLMAQYGYVEPDLHAHLMQHRQFEKEVESVQHDFSQISYEDCNVILTYLTNWLIKHICKVDQRFASFILARRKAENRGSTSGGFETGAAAEQDTDHLNSIEETIDTDNMGRYLAIAKDQIEGAGEMLNDLEICLGELRCYCDDLVKLSPKQSGTQASDEAYTYCVQGNYLVKSLQTKQAKLKQILDILAQSNA